VRFWGDQGAPFNCNEPLDSVQDEGGAAGQTGERKEVEIQEQTYRVGDPNKPQFDVVILHGIPVEFPRLDSTGATTWAAAHENSTLGWLERAITLGSESRASLR